MHFDERDLRRSKRYSVDGIYGNVLFAADITILNISMEGAAVESSRRFTMNREYSLKLTYGKQNLNLRGRVMWSRLSRSNTNAAGETTPVYQAGIKFSNLSPDDAHELFAFIDENKAEFINGRLPGVRFSVASPEFAVIDRPCEYKAKKMSMTGMLIETDHAFEKDTLVTLEMQIDQDASLAVSGRVAYCQSIMDDQSAFDVGLEFVDLTDQDRISLRNLLRTFDNFSPQT